MFYKLDEEKQAVVLKETRTRKVSVRKASTEILPANLDRKALAFVNNSNYPAYVSIAEETQETPPTGIEIGNYALIVPAKSQGSWELGTPLKAISVFYDKDRNDGEFIAIESW